LANLTLSSLQPYESRTANLFKVFTEVTLLLTLSITGMLRVGFGALSGVGIAGLRMQQRGQLGLSWRRRLREVRSKNRTVKFKNKMLTTVQTTSATAQKVGLDLVVPH
jgi:hypothetical protein